MNARASGAVPIDNQPDQEPTTDIDLASQVEPELPAAGDRVTSAAGESAPVGARASQRLWDDLRTAVERAVVGAREPLSLVLTALLAEGHVLVEDVPGTGKTLLARAVARALGLQTNRIQGTPDLLPVDVTGSSLYEGQSLRFAPGPVFTNILVVDEINRATPRTQSALLEAMQERQVSIEGTTRPLPEPFIVLATQNPIEFEGTFALPQAQLDRFLLRIRLGYPDEAAERSIARRYRAAAEPLESISAVADGPTLLRLRDAVRGVQVADEVEAYLVAVTRATRAHPDLQLGASPRATVALYRAAQAWAFLDGRTFVLPDDVKAMVWPVLAHRLVVDLDRSLRGGSVDAALSAVVAEVAVPPTSPPSAPG